MNEGCKIRKIGPDGLLQTLGTVNACAGTAMAVDSQGNVYVAAFDTSRNPASPSIASLSPAGQVSILPGTGGLTLMSGALALDSEDRVYILATTGLRRWTASRGLETLGWDKNLPNKNPGSYLAIDNSDRVYLEDASSNQLYRFAPDGTPTLAGRFSIIPSTPRGPFAVNPAGRVWASLPVPYLGGAVLRGLGLLGTSGVTQVTPCCGYSGDGGPAASARMNTIDAIAASPSGDIYILDAALALVRKVSGTVPASRPAIAGVANAASFQSGSAAPGELVSVFGSNFGQNGLSAYVPENNAVPGSLGNLAVFFNGTPGAIAAVTANQVNVFVPYEVAGAPNVSVVVVADGAASDPFSVPGPDRIRSGYRQCQRVGPGRDSEPGQFVELRISSRSRRLRDHALRDGRGRHHPGASGWRAGSVDSLFNAGRRSHCHGWRTPGRGAVRGRCAISAHRRFADQRPHSRRPDSR